jgi:2-aminoadipate transaminase
MTTRCVPARSIRQTALRLSQRALRTAEPPITFLMEQGVSNPALISLAAGLVDAESFPGEEVAAAAARLLAEPAAAARALQYGTTQGARRLRTLLAETLEAQEAECGRPMHVDPDELILTTGSQQLLFLVSDVLLDPGDIVLVGAPDYFVYLGLIVSLGATACGLAMDEAGIIPEALDEALRRCDRSGELPRVKLLYCTSYCQNPTGVTLSVSRRRALLEIIERWSDAGKILIVEDAAYRELQQSGPPPPSMRSFDETGETVILTQTFSKSFSPGLRLGYALVPEPLRSAILRQKGNHDFGSASFVQHLLAELVSSGVYREHITRLRAVYREKQQATLGALHEAFGRLHGAVRWIEPGGGLYVWLVLPESLDTRASGELFRRCIEKGVLYVPGEYCFPSSRPAVGGPMGGPHHTMRLSFGVQSIERIRAGIDRLSKAVAECLSAQ